MQLKNPLSVTAILLVAFFHSNAQKVRFSDVYISAGLNWASGTGTLEDFQKLAPDSKFINQSFSDFSNSNSYFYSGYHGTGRTSFLVGIDFKKNEEFSSSPQLRVGLTYSSSVLLSYSLSRDTRTPYDTLTSSRTGNQVFVDSVYYDNYSFAYSTENLLLDVSLIYRTNDAARWSLFGGVGLAGGISFNAITTADHMESFYTESRNSGYQTYPDYSDYYDSRYETEVFRNKNAMQLAAYIPLGVDFRIGNKSEFWKRVHLFGEVRAALNLSHIPEIGSHTQASFAHTFGIRIS